MIRIDLRFTALCLIYLVPIQMQAQQKVLTNRPPKPAKEAASRLYSFGVGEQTDFMFEREKTKWTYSLRDQEWIECESAGGLFGPTMFLIKGPRFLTPGKTQEYVLTCSHRYKGTVKDLWKEQLGQPNQKRMGPIYFDDDLEIEWEMRVSAGIIVISTPEFPKHSVRNGEPILAPFKIQLNGIGAQRVEIYANGYRNEKLVSSSYIPMTINRNGYQENAVEEEKKMLERTRAQGQSIEPTDYWTPFMISEAKRRSEEQHRLNGLRPGEYVTDTKTPH